MAAFIFRAKRSRRGMKKKIKIWPENKAGRFLLFFFIFARIFFFFLVGQKWRKKRSGGLFLFYLGGNIFFVFLFWRFLFLPPIIFRR